MRDEAMDTMNGSSLLVPMPSHVAGNLTEAKKGPAANPANFVPVFDWDSKRVWVWVQKPGGKVLGPVEILHGDVQSYAGKLGWLPQAMEYQAQLDPTTYSDPSHLYPSDWEAGDPIPVGEPEKTLTKAKYSPPVAAAPPETAPSTKTKLPPEFSLTGKKDPNGFETAEDEGSGETYSLLPNGQFGKWEGAEGVYYIAKKEDGEWDIHLDSPVYTPAELKPKKAPEPVALPAEFSLPPNHTVKTVTSAYVKVTTPDGKDVKWIKATDHWVYADNPSKDYEPLQATVPSPAPAAKPKAPKKAKATKGTVAAPVQAAPPPAMVPGAVPPAPSPPAPAPAPEGQPSTSEPKAAQVAAAHPEPAPHLTKYTGKVDVNGLPMVDEIGEGDAEESEIATDLTLLPDERVAKWQETGSYYALYDYHPHFGFMWSKKGESMTADDAKKLMSVLSLTVKNAKYHKVTSAAPVQTAPAATTYQTPIPPHTNLTSKTDLHGLPIVTSIPGEEEDINYELSVLPNGVTVQWYALVKKYQVWEWGSIMGNYNYYPAHPSKYISLKEVKKLQAQAQGLLGAATQPAVVPPPSPKATGPVVQPPATAPEVPEKPKVSSGPTPVPGMLKPTGKKDENGYSLGTYGATYSMLPDNKVGVWSAVMGAYIVYKYDPTSDTYYSTMTTWTPPGFHKSLANQSVKGSKAQLASVSDHLGTDVLILPNGKFAKYSAGDGTYLIYKADLTTDKVFVPTGQTVPSADVVALTKTPGYKSMTPMGALDPNGLPMFKVNGATASLSMLPNGALGQWRAQDKLYRQFAFDETDGEWGLAMPLAVFTLNDVEAMYLKSGATLMAAVAGAAPVAPVQPAKPVAMIVTLPPILKSVGKNDSNGYPMVKAVLPHLPVIMSVMPNGIYAKMNPEGTAYRKMWFDTTSPPGEWVLGEPGEHWTVAEVQAWGPPPIVKESTAPVPVVTPTSPEIAPTMPTVQKPEAIPTVPIPTGKLPQPGDLDYLGTGKSQDLAGQGDKEVFQDPKTGQKYIFKIAATKGAGKVAAPYKIASQQGFAAIAALARPDAHVPVEVSSYKGKTGTLQPMLETQKGQGNLAGVSPTSLTSQQKTDVASEHMLDWLMSQHDSFASNLIVTKEGRIVGVDKEQGWRFVEGIASGPAAQHTDRLSTDYAPNSILHGEQAPYYNSFWKAFANGSLDFDPKTALPTLEKIEAIPAETLERVLDSYLATLPALAGPEKTYERYRFTKKMLSRRATLRADFEAFITEQYQARTKEPGKFTFKEGWVLPGAEDEPKWQTVNVSIRELALQQLGPNAIKPHKDNPNWVLVRVDSHQPITKVEEFLANMGVKAVDTSPVPNPIMGSNYNSIVVNAADLTTKITKTIEIKKEAGQKFANHPGVPTYFPTCEAPDEAPGNVEGLKKAPALRLGPLGKNFTLDSDAVEQQTVSIQRVIKGTDTYYVAHFKLREQYWRNLTGGKSGSYGWPMGAYDATKDALVLSSYGGTSTDQPATIFSFPGGDEVAVLGSGAKWAFKGSVYATIRGKDVDIYGKLKTMLAKLDLDAKVMKNPTAEDIELYKMAQALWCYAPQTHKNLKPEDINVETLKKKLKGVVTKDQLAALRQVDGTAGRGSPIIPGIWKTLGGGTPEKPVVRFVFWRVKTTSVASILKSAATGVHERLRLGLGVGCGASETDDMTTGGADNTTMRLATANGASTNVHNTGNIGYGYGRVISLIVAPEVLDRLDVHFADGDSFGCTNYDYSGGQESYWGKRDGLSKAVEKFDVGGNHGGSKELVLRRGVPPRMIKRVVADSEEHRKEVLEFCEQAGISEHNGCPIEDFIVVDGNQGAIYEKYLKPLGY